MAYTTADYVAAELNGMVISSSTTPASDDITRWIKEAKSIIEQRTGRIWEADTDTSALFDHNGGKYFRFPVAPIISVSTLEYEENGLGADSESWVSLTEGRTNDFIVYVNDGEIEFTSKNYTPVAGKQNIRATYTYGYATTPPYISRLATLMVAARVIQTVINGTASTEGGSVTVGNISITDPSMTNISHLRAINQEIEQLFARVGDSTRVHRNTRYYELRN